MGSCAGIVMVGPTKVKTCKSILFTEGIPEVRIILKLKDTKQKV